METERMLSPFFHGLEADEHGEAIDTSHSGATVTRGSQEAAWARACLSLPCTVRGRRLDLDLGRAAKVTTQPLLPCSLT